MQSHWMFGLGLLMFYTLPERIGQVDETLGQSGLTMKIPRQHIIKLSTDPIALSPIQVRVAIVQECDHRLRGTRARSGRFSSRTSTCVWTLRVRFPGVMPKKTRRAPVASPSDVEGRRCVVIHIDRCRYGCR